MRKRIAYTVVLAIAGAALVPAVAQATRSTVKITVHQGGSDIWIGEVKSSKLSCQNGRTVTMFRKQSGSDPKIGKDKTESGKGDSEGVFIIEDPNPLKGSTYYAKVKEKDNCDADKSKDFDYPEDQPF